MPELTTADGLDLAYFEWGTEHRGVQPPVVLQHGFVASTELNWVLPGIVGALVAAGRHVVGLDARGHGESAKPHDSSFYGEANMAADLSALYDVLGVPVVHQVGYSMGAIISLIAASRDDRVGRLVVGGVGAGVVELGGVDTRELSSDALAEALLAEDPSQLDDAAARSFREFADSVGADRLALAAQAQVVHATPIALDAITAATLVVAGDRDPLADRPQVLAAAIADARLTVVGGDHFGALLDPELTNAIVAFLAG